MKSKKLIEVTSDDSNILMDNDNDEQSSTSWVEKLRRTSKVPYLPIDNSNHFYVPVHLSCGVVIQCHINAIVNSPKHCLQILPQSVTSLIKRTKIWINTDYQYGSIQRPTIVKHCTTHHSKHWLLQNRDNPAKAHGIEIYSCREFLKLRTYWNGYGLILHELCHLIHQFVLPNGLEHKSVKHVYENAFANKNKLYRNVFRRDWCHTKSNPRDMAYALVNHKEFFAELSVTYLCNFYSELDDKLECSTTIEECSPPFILHDHFLQLSSCCESSTLGVDMILPHCNKFFPFTRGQLKNYDREVFEVFRRLWEVDIALWKDGNDVNQMVSCTSCFSLPDTVCL